MSFGKKGGDDERRCRGQRAPTASTRARPGPTEQKAINKGTKENKREEKANVNGNNKHKSKDKDRAKWICEQHCLDG